jgi:hypothetical protein
MAPRTDFLAKQREQIDARLRELQPAHEEYLTLLKARDALAAVKPPDGRRGPGRPAGKRGPGRPPGKRGPGRPRGSRTTTTRATTARAAGGNGRRTARRGRGRRSNTRADQALALIKQNPGIKVPDIAKQMGIRQNYLYRVTAGLQKQRLVRRRDGGFHAA